MSQTDNITWHDSAVSKEHRRTQNHHHSFVIWLTGLSGSGKSTIANELAKELFQRKVRNYVLDGDNIRHGLNKDLGFSDEDRKENIRRIGEVSKLFVDGGQVVITAFISPFIEDRERARQIVGKDEFIEIYVDCPLEECENRDPKGLYKKARKGEIKEFTGIDSPYEEPISPDFTVNTHTSSVPECTASILSFLESKSFIEKS